MWTRTLLVVAASLAGGCSTMTDYGIVHKESLRNDQGAIIGSKELLRNEQTGEVMAQIALYTPIRDDSGAIVGYEERTRDGAILHDLDGHRIGARFADLRSRGVNKGNRGLTIVLRPADAQVAAVARPKVGELVAALSKSDLRRIQ